MHVGKTIRHYNYKGNQTVNNYYRQLHIKDIELYVKQLIPKKTKTKDNNDVSCISITGLKVTYFVLDSLINLLTHRERQRRQTETESCVLNFVKS
jgi:hypothetical protein